MGPRRGHDSYDHTVVIDAHQGQLTGLRAFIGADKFDASGQEWHMRFMQVVYAAARIDRVRSEDYSYRRLEELLKDRPGRTRPPGHPGIPVGSGFPLARLLLTKRCWQLDVQQHGGSSLVRLRGCVLGRRPN